MTARKIAIAVLLATLLTILVPLFLASMVKRLPEPRPPPYAFEIWPAKP